MSKETEQGASQPDNSGNQNDVLEGFLHNLSPTKPNSFQFGLQTKDTTYRVNCFSPPKRKLFEDGSPARIKNFKKGKIGNVINVDEAELTINKNIDLDFPLTKIAGNVDLVSLSKCIRNQFVAVKGVISKLGKTRTSNHGKSADCCLTDSTASVKFVIWEKHIESVKNNGSYMISMVRVDFDQYGHPYIHTSREDCEIKKIEDLNISKDTASLITLKEREIKGEFMGVDYIEQYKRCMKCKKKIKTACDKVVVECTNSDCKLLQKTKALISSVYGRVIFQDENAENHSVTLFDDVIMKILPGAGKMTEKQLQLDLLSLPGYSLTYNTQSKVVLDMEPL